MANRTKVLGTLKDYFEQKGRVLSSQEYSRETDTPIRLQVVRNTFGSWNRLEKLLMAREERVLVDTGQVTDVDAILAARNKAAWEAAEQWREASENQDAKAKKEAEAQVVAETLARNAATPEGANANKIAIGGKLPQEQQDYTAMGATVVKNPETGEQKIVDTDPEILTTANDDPKTPTELRDAVAADGAKTGTVPVDTSTGGGSQGTPSTDTVNALGADTADADKVADKTTTNTTSTENTRTPNDETKGQATKK